MARARGGEKRRGKAADNGGRPGADDSDAPTRAIVLLWPYGLEAPKAVSFLSFVCWCFFLFFFSFFALFCSQLKISSFPCILLPLRSYFSHPMSFALFFALCLPASYFPTITDRDPGRLRVFDRYLAINLLYCTPCWAGNWGMDTAHHLGPIM
ncbi:hypothetical protein B0H10DRAFT_1997849 [Mycena sp. CBHHK59/15]|nr:hypothetical protein B0H10DRAFT_1997849 [Mycena sp. CBHHK59/15]